MPGDLNMASMGFSGAGFIGGGSLSNPFWRE